jgi:hypothetical protein
VRDFVVSARFLATEHAELAWRCVLPCQVMVAVGSLLTGLVGGARDLSRSLVPSAAHHARVLLR